jgi:hypothetical protein
MRIVTSFIGFLLAIVIAIFIFAPERLPVGYGFEPVPVELVVENTLAGDLVQAVTGKNGKDLVISNTSQSPINNLTITLRDKDMKIKNQYVSPVMPAANQIRLGWAKEWQFENGDELEISASAYYKVVFAL